ncbi:MAG: NUDIX hydrolase [Acidobacteriaceae bacterium]
MSSPPFSEAYIIQQLDKARQSKHESSHLWDFLASTPRPAAVLIPLFHREAAEGQISTWQVLLTRRTNSVAEHQGQVAFPGGRADPTDTTPEMTALREAHEEVGLDPTRVKILGRMDPMWTISNYLVTPIVGVIPWPFHLHLEETEVSRAFSVPLDWLADPKNHEFRLRTIPAPFARILHRDKHPVIYFQPYDGEILWGVSAEITLRLINILYGKELAGD